MGMGCLLDLPNELLHEILNVTWPEDLENFASTCKLLRAQATPLLQEHRIRIKKYGLLRNDEAGRLASVLEDVLSIPFLGHYVRRIEVAHFRRHGDIKPGRKTPFTQALLESAYYSYHNPTSDWIDRIEGGDEEHLLSLLLPFLPNVNSIEMENCDGNRTCFHDMIVQTPPRIHQQLLARLSKITLNSGDHIPLTLGEVLPYAALDSVQQLCVRDMAGSTRLSGFLPRLEHFVPGGKLTHLDLWHCALNSGILSKFLCRLRLRVFQYSSIVRTSSLDLTPLAEALLVNSKTTLQKLTLLVRNIKSPFRSMRTMGEFENLEVLRSEWPLLLPRGFLDGTENLSLGDILPGTLKTIQLRDEFGEHGDEYGRLVELAVIDRVEGRSQLQTLVLSGHPDWEFNAEITASTLAKGWRVNWEMLREWQERCKAVGIDLQARKKLKG